MNTPRKTRESLLRTTLLALAAVSAAQAQTNNYFGSNGTLSGNVWSTAPAGPYTSALVTTGGAIINFENPATFTGASIAVAGINATANATSNATGGTISNLSNGVIPINVSSGATLDFGAQGFTTSATAGYVKTGAGTLAFSGGSFGGGFTLNSGMVIVRGVNTFGANGTLTINGGIIAASANRSLNGKYSSIIVGGDFQLGDFTNSVSLSNATLSANAFTTLGNATRTITIGANATYTLSGVINGDPGTGLTLNALPGATGALVLNNSQAILPTAFSSNTTVVSLASTTGVVVGQLVGGTGIAANTVVSAIGTGNITLSLPTSASNNGTASLNISGSFYNGGTTLNSGVLQVGSSSAFSGLGVLSSSAIGTGNLTLNGGVLSTVSSNGQSIYVPSITVGGNFTVAQTSGGTGRVSIAGNINLAGGNRTLTLGKASTSYGSGNEVLRFEAVPAFAAANIIQNGALTVTTLTGNATNPSILRTGSGATVNFAGNTPLTLDDGVAFSSGTGSLFGTGANAPALTLNAPVTRGGGVLQMGDGGAVVRNGEVYSLAGGGTVSITNSTGGSGTLTINNGNGANFSGVIQGVAGNGTIAVTKSGNGTQTLSGNNSYVGLTTVSAGTLKLGHPSALGSTTGNTTVSSGAVLDLDGQTVGNEAVSLNGSGISSTGALITTTGNASLSGPVTLSGDATVGVVNTGNTTTTLTLSGGIAEAVVGRQFTKVGEGTLILTGNSTFTGPLRVFAGTVQIASPAALPAGATLNSGGSTGDTTLLNLASADPGYAMSALSVGGIMRISAPASGTATLTFAGSTAQGFTGSAVSKKLSVGDNVNVIVNGSSFELLGNVSLDRSHNIQVDGNGTLTFNTPLIATGSAFTAGVIKIGTGLLTLSANNSYTGTTTVSAGTLALAGSQASPLTVSAGAALRFALNDGLSPIVTSTSSLALSANSTVGIVGTPSGNTTYTLYSASAITGTPVLAAPITGFSLVVESNALKLKPTAVSDTTKPIITLIGSSTPTVNAGSTYTDAGATATDETAPLNPTVITTGTVNTAVPGNYVLSYDAVDTAGNAALTVTRTVTVVDVTAPVITRTGAATVSVDWGSSYTDAGATATDNVAPFTATVITSGTVNTAKPGTYTLTYNATDVASNAATPVTRTVTVAIANPTTVGADGYTPLMRYALGATGPGDTVTAPVTSSTATELSLTAVVRTDDPKLTVLAKTNTDLTASGGWTATGVTVSTSGDTSPVPNGCVRNVYTVTITGASKKFLRLEAVLAP